MSMRAISRVLQVPLGTVFTWIKRYGKRKYPELLDLWSRAKDVAGEGVKVVDEMWTYVKRNAKAFYAWVFTAFLFSRRGMYVAFSVGDRGERTFQELRQYLPEKGTWVSDDYNLYFLLPKHTVVSPVNPNEPLHSSLRDRLVRFKRATKTVNRSLEMMKYSVGIVLWERGLILEFITS